MTDMGVTDRGATSLRSRHQTHLSSTVLSILHTIPFILDREDLFYQFKSSHLPRVLSDQNCNGLYGNRMVLSTQIARIDGMYFANMFFRPIY